MKKQKQETKPGINLFKIGRKYAWVLYSEKGKSILKSGLFQTKQGCTKNITSVMRFFDNNQHYWDHTRGIDHLVVVEL